MSDMVGRIMAYESGELDENGVVQLFADLIKTGLAWQLQGCYGRQAKQLIEAGVISPDGEIRTTPAREELHKTSFATLLRAAQNNDVCILKCTRKSDGSDVWAICAMNRHENGDTDFVPLGELYVSVDPFELIDPPEQK